MSAELPTLDETPFRVALIGDWSGRVNRSLFASSGELAASRPLAIDRDNLDRVLSKLGVNPSELLGGGSDLGGKLGL